MKYGTINDSEPLVSKPSNDSSSRKYLVLIVGALILVSFGLFHTTHGNSMISYLFSADDTLTYTVTGTLCDNQYAGDNSANDIYYAQIRTDEGYSEQTALTSSELERNGEFTVEITATNLGDDIRSVSISSEAEDAICISEIAVTVGDYTVSESDLTLWISGDCEGRPTLTPCSATQTVSFMYYFVSSVKDDWDTVREACQSEGGDLAMFDSEAAMDVIYGLCAAVIDTATQSCYVGFEDFDVLNDWEWIDGTEFDMTDYIGRFDTSSWDRCGCISMRSSYTEAQPLADCTCDWKYGLWGICQSEPIDTTTSSAAKAVKRKAPVRPKGITAMDETGGSLSE